MSWMQVACHFLCCWTVLVSWSASSQSPNFSSVFRIFLPAALFSAIFFFRAGAATCLTVTLDRVVSYPITLLIFCAPCDAFLANWSRFSCDDGPFFVNASVSFAAAAGLRRTTRLGGLVPERGEIMARIQLATKQHDPLEGMHPEDQDAPNMTGGPR